MAAHAVGGPTGLRPVPAEAALEGEIVRRAGHLCLRAEPHAEESPCPAHLAEARRQLLALQG